MTGRGKAGGENNRAAVWWMMANVLASSFFPLIVAVGGTNQSPFFFTAMDNLVSCLVILIVIAGLRPRLLAYKTLAAVFSPSMGALAINLNLLPCIIRGLAATPFFLLATNYISIVAVVIIYETWPIVKILVMERLFKDSIRFRPVTFGMLLLFGFSLVGLAFITIGQSPGSVPDIGIDAPTLLGGGFALAASLLTALAPSFSLKHGTMARENIQRASNEDHGELFCSLISTFIQRFIAGAIALGLALVLQEYLTGDGLVAGVVAGVLTAIASIGIRYANLLTNNLGVNALRYTNPVLAIAWICLFFSPEYPHSDFLLIGAVIIVAANLFLNFDGTRRHC